MRNKCQFYVVQYSLLTFLLTNMMLKEDYMNPYRWGIITLIIIFLVLDAIKK